MINPNTSSATTAAMKKIAEHYCPQDLHVEGKTAPFGAPLITEPQQLEIAAAAVGDVMRASRDAYDGFIIAAFGDPGLEALRPNFSQPLVGIAAASIAEAARGGRSFSIVTTTPALKEHIVMRCHKTGYGENFKSIRFTETDAAALCERPGQLFDELTEAVRKAIDLDGAEAVIIGGGPLATAARHMQKEFNIPIIEPIKSAVLKISCELGL